MGEKAGDKGSKTGAGERHDACAGAGAGNDWEVTYECLRSGLSFFCSFAASSSCTARLKRRQKLGSWTMMRIGGCWLVGGEVGRRFGVLLSIGWERKRSVETVVALRQSQYACLRRFSSSCRPKCACVTVTILGTLHLRRAAVMSRLKRSCFSTRGTRGVSSRGMHVLSHRNTEICCGERRVTLRNGLEVDFAGLIDGLFETSIMRLV